MLSIIIITLSVILFIFIFTLSLAMLTVSKRQDIAYGQMMERECKKNDNN